MSDANVKVVQDAYQAFKTGDAARLFGAMTPDISWESVGRSSDYRGFGPRKGLPATQEFFAMIARDIDFTDFSPREFYPSGADKVFVTGHYAQTLKKNGRKSASDFVHVFTLRGGKVAGFREFADTASFAEAWRG